MNWREWKARLRGSRSLTELERQMDEEMRFHVEMATQRNIRRGATPERARREALLAFGGNEAFKEEAREAQRARWLENLVGDARYGLRTLLKSPAFSLAAVLTVAVGIGANTAVFSVVNGVLGALPLPHPEELIYVGWNWGNSGSTPALSPYQYEYTRKHARSLRVVTAYQVREYDLNPAAATPALGLAVTEDFFEVVGITPSQGRAFAADEQRTGGAAVVVIGNAFWRARLGGDPAIVGKSIRLGDVPHTVVGVLPASYRFPAAPQHVDFVVPLRLQADVRDEGHNYTVLARVLPGWSAQRRAADLAALSRSFRAEHPELAGQRESFQLFTHTEAFVGELEGTLWVLLGAVLLVLLIGCVNTANLLLVRATARQREIAVRSALGASRLRIAQQLLAEGLVLALVSGIVGVAIGTWSVKLVLTAAPAILPRVDEIGLDLRVLAFVLLVTIVTGLVFGLATALPALRVSLQNTLQQGARGSTPGRRHVRDVLVLVETAVAIVLLAGAGLLINSFARLHAVDPGFDPEQLIAVRLGRMPAQYANDAQLLRFEEEALAALRAIPGVSAVATASNFPLERGINFPVDTREHPERGLGAVELRRVSPDYLEALRLPLRKGRNFNAQDHPGGEWVALVNEAFVRHFWPDEEPVGSTIQVGHFKGNWVNPRLERQTRVIGVVADMREIRLDRDSRPTVLLLRSQAHDGSPPAIMVRTDRANRVMPAIRTALTAVEPRMPVPELERMRAIVDRSIAAPRFRMLILSLFAACALLLAAIGVYGVIAVLVEQSRREIGLRMALGATSGGIAIRVLRRCMLLVVTGALIGVALALGLTRFLAGMVYGISVTDPRTFALALGVFCLVGAIAGYLPARRAARLDPALALRAE